MKTTRNYAVNYDKTQEDVPGHPGLIKLKKSFICFLKKLKIAN